MATGLKRRAVAGVGGGVLVLVLALLVGVGGSDAFAQAPNSNCPDADRQRNYNCPDGPAYLIPGLTDLNGFKDRSHYSNILYGDLTGDKVDEMVVRSVGGVQVFRFDRAVGQWTQVKVTGRILADAGGWGAPQYYNTIRLGDIDGDSRAEIVARSSEGILVFKYNAADQDHGEWQQVTTSGPMKNGDCWTPPGGGQHLCWDSLPGYYSTIELTPLGRQGSKPTMQLIGRSRYGLELYRWNGSGWDTLPTLTAVGDENPKWRDDPAYYSTILPLSTTDVLVQDVAGMQVYRYDGGGWAPQGSPAPFPAPQPESSYATLQLFGGLGGGPVVLRRGQAGAQLWQWSGSAWSPLAGGALPLSNGDGFNRDPSYYRTIQAADIDGDGLDELLSRASTGMIAYRFNTSTKQWTGPISNSTPGLANDPWSDPAYYTTIKTARLDPDKPARSLLARGRTGVRTWYFDPSANQNTWTRYQPYGFPSLPTQAYQAMNTLLGVENGEIRDVYATNPSATYVSTAQTKITATCTGQVPSDDPVAPPKYQSCAPPAGASTSPADWTTVANQILAELYWTGPANDYFTTLASVQDVVQRDQNGVFGSITDDLKLNEAENVAAPSVNFLELFEGIFDILAVIPEAGELFEVTGAALGIADASSESLDSEPTEFDKKISELQSTLATIQEEAEDAITQHRRYVLGDYGLMRTVGRLKQTQLWQLDTLAARSASRQGFAQWIYSEYLPTIWDHWDVDNCKVRNGCAQQGKLMPFYAPYDPDGTVSFKGLVPRQGPCGSFYCGWYSLESHGFTDTINTLVDPPTPSCVYDGKGDTDIWEFGKCTLGLSPSELLRTDSEGPINFRDFDCNYAVQSNDERYCWNVQNSHGVAAGAARGVGTRRGTVDLSAVAPLRRDLDLRRGKVELFRLLDEGGGARELVNRRPGRDAVPRTLRLKRGAKRHRARFATPRGTRPRIRGTLTVRVRKVSVGRGRRTRIRRVHSLGVRLRIDRAHLERPRSCGARNATHLGVHLLVTARRGRRGQVLETVPWGCPKGGRMSYRAARSRARVTRTRLRVRRHSPASIPLRCGRGPMGCRGTLALRARLGGGRPFVVGRGRFSIRPGGSARVRVRLTARARRALAANGRLAVAAKVDTRHPAFPALVSRKRLALIAR
jgi:hypothetical protein